jgi:DNA-binding IclR family transcriptional regulator
VSPENRAVHAKQTLYSVRHASRRAIRCGSAQMWVGKGVTLQMAESKRPQQGVQSVEIGLEIASALAGAGTSLPLGEIAELAGLSASKTHRYLVSLCRSGLIEQIPQTGRYDLGYAAIRLGLEAQSRIDEFRLLDECMRGLFEMTHEALAALTWGGVGPTVVRRLESVQPIIVSARIGATLSVVGPASGALFAAFLPTDVIDPIVNAEFAARNKPAMSRREFNEQVQAARRTKLAVTTGGYISGFDALAAPVFNASRELVMTISMLAPTGTADFSLEGSLAKELRDSTERFSRRLGMRENDRTSANSDGL